jgi:hypothetical protein
VFKCYRPQARQEKLLKATAQVYFDAMKWPDDQTKDALKIIEPRIGTEIFNLKHLAKSILLLRKPCSGCLPDFDYDGEFRAAGEKDKTIQLILGDSSGRDAKVQ